MCIRDRNKAANAKSYNIYRAEGRYAEYKLIDSIDGAKTSYTDTNPNPTSKYKNYYKVQAVNGNVNGEESEPVSYTHLDVYKRQYMG